MTGIDFARWTAKVLHEPQTRTLLSGINNLVFPADTPGESAAALAAWAKANGINLRWEAMTTRSGRQDQWVYTTHRSP